MSPETQLEVAVSLVASNVRDPALRAQFLDQACAGDARLRAAVEDLLSARDAAEDFFAQGRAAVKAAEVTATVGEYLGAMNLDELAGEAIGLRVGRYQLLQKLGEGGCGTVYLAEQAEPVRRQVALKVIKLGMDTKSVIARFEAERQALALMDHPNIARVLDAGATETGRPFFVMELVRGTRITKYCDDHNLDTIQRLNLIIPVCRAIQHAHQKGIIHRDIKPSNILVTLHDGLPVPKVIDFGIAKATEGRLADDTLFTAVEHFIGTPAYMSPEQAEQSGLDIDTRSDIYSLGVLLYELLTGRTPFDGQTLMRSGPDQIRRTLREQEPQLPSTMITSLPRTELTLTADQRQAAPPKLISQLKGDLDWIVMKALEKDRNRRYETANGLALDIQRYLNNEPVMASPPGRLYRLRKLVRRNKIVFAAGGAIALALLIGLALSTWLFFRERAAHEREVQLRAAAEDRAKITQAVMLVSQGQYDDANQVLEEVKTPPSQPTLDGVSAFRSVGERLALQERWPEAAKRYAALIKIDKLDGWNVVAVDYQAYGVVLAESGDTDQYEYFCNLAVTNFASEANGDMLKNGGVLKTCLLFPADKKKLDALKPMARNESKIWTFKLDPKNTDWAFIPPGLWEYRRGNYAAAAHWCEYGLTAQNIKFPACDATLHLILAMTDYQRGQSGAACSELAQGRQLVEAKFHSGLDHGKSGLGYWYDWVFASLMLKEASGLIDCNTNAPALK